MTQKYSVKKNADRRPLHPWHVRNPEGQVVWRSTHQSLAFSIAHMFATRRALRESIESHGLRITTMP